MPKSPLNPHSENALSSMVVKAWCKSLHRVVSLVIHELPNGVRRLYFSTDESMDGRDVVEYYATRFQEEFCFRDAKQFLCLLITSLDVSRG